MTQRMPRVPLPVLSDEEAAERSAAQQALEHGPTSEDDDGAEADDGMASPPDRPRWRRRTALALALVVLLGVAATGSLLWVRTQYYVGAHNGQVVVFRGVDGSILGVTLSSVAENSLPAAPMPPRDACRWQLADLVPAARDQVDRRDHRRQPGRRQVVMQRLTGQLLPICDTIPPDRRHADHAAPTQRPADHHPQPQPDAVVDDHGQPTTAGPTGTTATSPTAQRPSTAAHSTAPAPHHRRTHRRPAPSRPARRAAERTAARPPTAATAADLGAQRRTGPRRAAASSAASVADAARAAARGHRHRSVTAPVASTGRRRRHGAASRPAPATFTRRTSRSAPTQHPTTHHLAVTSPRRRRPTDRHHRAPPVPGVDCR